MYKNIDITKLISFTKKLKILYVEDNKESQEAFEALLGNYFSNIIVVSDGMAAFERFKNEKFDLLITDIRMPKMDGIELIKNIRKTDEDIPIIVSTAHKESDYLIKCIEMGVGGYLLKPINHKQLLKVIKCICGRLYYMQETNNYERNLEKLVQKRTKELENIQEHLLELTHRDPLTNLHNRRYVNEVMDTLIHISHREKTPFSMLMLDIDKFKNINDKYGHLNGDIVLKKLAKILLNNTRKSDVVIRFGGEEFLILLPNTERQGALGVANTIHSIVEKTEISLKEDKKTYFTVSIGVSVCTCLNFKDKNELIESADKAMYEAKINGRNRVIIYD